MWNKREDKLVLANDINALLGVEVWFHTFLTSEIEEKVANFTPRKGIP